MITYKIYLNFFEPSARHISQNQKERPIPTRHIWRITGELQINNI